MKNLIYPLFLPMLGCPHRCIYCEQNKISGAGLPDWDKELHNVAAFVANHSGEPKEIAFYGGSFTALPYAYRADLLSRFQAVVDAQTSFRISTHPLYISPEILKECREQGIKCIELGIQDFSDKVLEASGRGYTYQQALSVAEIVQQHGFTLGVQLMPGLPGSSEETIAENKAVLKQLRPDYLRLYPLVVIKGTPLEQMYYAGEYKPLDLETAVSICVDYAELAEQHGITIIKLGLPSNLPADEVVCGPYHPAFGELVLAERLVRQLVDKAKQGLELNLDKKQRALIMGHKGFYKVILENRLRNCCVDNEVITRLLNP